VPNSVPLCTAFTYQGRLTNDAGQQAGTGYHLYDVYLPVVMRNY